MHSAAEQLERKLLVRRLGNYHQAQCRRALHNFLDGVNRILRERGFKNQNFSREFICRGNRLGQCFRLANYADVIFNRKNFAQPGAEDRLRVGHDHTNELFCALHLRRGHSCFSRAQSSTCHELPFPATTQRRSKRYSSMTTPTPRRPPCSLVRATLPRHCTFTSASEPTTSAGNEIVKSTVDPTAISTSC